MAGELERAIMQRAFEMRMGYPNEGGLTSIPKGGQPRRGTIGLFDETFSRANMPQNFGPTAPMPAMRPEYAPSAPMPSMRPNRGLVGAAFDQAGTMPALSFGAPMPSMRPGYGMGAPLPSMRPSGGLLGAMQNFSAPMPSMRPATAAAIARAIPSARSDPAAPVSAGYAPNYRAAPDYGAPRHRPGQDVSEPISDPNSRTNASIGKSFASDVKKAFSRSARSDPSSPVSGGGRSGGSLK